MNIIGIWALYKHEMSRFKRTVGQSIIAPVISTVLYFIVFGSALGTRINIIEGIHYGTFIVPGLVMLNTLSHSVSNASFAMYFPRFTGTVYEILTAPLSPIELIIGYVGAAATKSLILAFIVLLTATLFVPLEIRHPIWMLFFLLMTCISFSMVGFIVGMWADGFEKLQIIPLLVITPLSFLGGSFYSLHMLPPFWQKISLFNPVVYLISAFKWSFFEVADVNLEVSVAIVIFFLIASVLLITWRFNKEHALRD